MVSQEPSQGVWKPEREHRRRKPRRKAYLGRQNKICLSVAKAECYLNLSSLRPFLNDRNVRRILIADACIGYFYCRNTLLQKERFS